MSEFRTIRERIERATSYFRDREGIVLTTFSLSATFLEDNALPTLLGVESNAAPARSAELHHCLARTPCTVFYDPAMRSSISGKYRYVARPVPLRARLFHPKLVVIAGPCMDDTTWAYLAVSSANLTLSGWGRNAESFGETWIHTKRQQTWEGMDRLLEWLQKHAPLGEKRTRADAVVRVRAALARMPDRKRFKDDGKAPWSGSLYANLYSSVVDTDGLSTFLQMGRSRSPAALRAYSPYWGDVSKLVATFNAKSTVLVPARRIDGSAALGLGKEQTHALGDDVGIRYNDKEVGDRFWHMKAYWIAHGNKYYTAVGSCNFTHAGIAGEKGNGNVEAMLVFEADPEWLAKGKEAKPEDLSDKPPGEEEAPVPTPLAIVVAYDWEARSWRWNLEAGDGQQDFRLDLPGLEPFPIVPGMNERSGDPPTRSASFTVRYLEDREREWRGQVVELNLDYSERVYGGSLTANEILESWRGSAPTWDLGAGGSGADVGDDGDAVETEVPAAFDAVNLYDLYRSIRALRKKLADPKSRPEAQRALLVSRPDSVMALCNLAAREGEAPIVRYLVLRELYSIVREAKTLLDADGEKLLETSLACRARKMAHKARADTGKQLSCELEGDSEKAEAILQWFEKRLAQWDRRAT